MCCVFSFRFSQLMLHNNAINDDMCWATNNSCSYVGIILKRFAVESINNYVIIKLRTYLGWSNKSLKRGCCAANNWVILDGLFLTDKRAKFLMERRFGRCNSNSTFFWCFVLAIKNLFTSKYFYTSLKQYSVRFSNLSVLVRAVSHSDLSRFDMYFSLICIFLAPPLAYTWNLCVVTQKSCSNNLQSTNKFQLYSIVQSAIRATNGTNIWRYAIN